MDNLFLKLVGNKTVIVKLDQINFKESAIIEGCIEFFDDHNPCFIHKSAVKARFIEQIQSYYRGAEAVLPQSITDKIDCKGLKQTIIFKKEN